MRWTSGRVGREEDYILFRRRVFVLQREKRSDATTCVCEDEIMCKRTNLND